MSMREYAVRDYGVLIYEEDLLEEYLEEYENNGYIDVLENYSDFEGEMMFLDPSRPHTYSPGEYFFFGQSERFPSMFSRAYNNYEELKTELKDNYSKFVKEDFPWDDRIVELNGTIFE